MSRAALLLALVFTLPELAAAADKPALRLINPFFAFDNGVGQGQLTAAEQAQTLAELGYAGMGSRGVAGFDWSSAADLSLAGAAGSSSLRGGSSGAPPLRSVRAKIPASFL